MVASRFFGTLLEALFGKRAHARSRPAPVQSVVILKTRIAAAMPEEARARSVALAQQRPPVPAAAPVRTVVPVAPIAPVTAAPVMAAPVMVAPPVVVVPRTPAPVQEVRAVAKPQRTLEEVRADLARLRETARERHAEVQQRRVDTSFAPTDFMDMPEPMPMPAPVSRSNPARERERERARERELEREREREREAEPEFASTAYLDFGGAIPLLGR